MRRLSRGMLAGLTILSLVGSGPVGAQGTVARDSAGTRRQQMEQQLRQGMWRIARRRVGLNDEQMRRLEETAARFDTRRRAILAEDRAQRQVLRAELQAGDAANQDRVAAALDRLLQIQRQRADLNAEEQHELSQFMTPVQRARYAALQEQVRRRADALRRARREGQPAR